MQAIDALLIARSFFSLFGQRSTDAFQFSRQH